MADGFVYKWTNQINGKWYIGSHKGTIDDGYRHSSKVLASAERKYGYKAFVREILYEGNDYRQVEAKFLHSHNAANNHQSYNRTNVTGPGALSLASRMKTSRTMKGMIRGPQTKEHIEKKRKSQTGLKRSAETRKRISLAKKGEKNPMFGKILTAEHRQKVGEGLRQAYATGTRQSAQKGKPAWNKGMSQQKATCPYCNTVGGISVMKRHHFDRCKNKKSALLFTNE